MPCVASPGQKQNEMETGERRLQIAPDYHQRIRAHAEKYREWAGVWNLDMAVWSLIASYALWPDTDLVRIPLGLQPNMKPYLFQWPRTKQLIDPAWIKLGTRLARGECG